MKVFSITIFMLFAAGCQQQVSLDSWRNSVEHYVQDQANGDVSVLRDLATSGPWKGFSVISENDPAAATDVNGVLLAHQQIGSKNYFVYLVGLVRQQQVQDIRLALLSAGPDGHDWRWSPQDKDGFRLYHDYQDAQWHKLFPQRQVAPWSYSGFPCEGDVFTISVTGRRVTATHERSGAQWTLELPQDGPTTAPSLAGSN